MMCGPAQVEALRPKRSVTGAWEPPREIAAQRRPYPATSYLSGRLRNTQSSLDISVAENRSLFPSGLRLGADNPDMRMPIGCGAPPSTETQKSSVSAPFALEPLAVRLSIRRLESGVQL